MKFRFHVKYLAVLLIVFLATYWNDNKFFKAMIKEFEFNFL